MEITQEVDFGDHPKIISDFYNKSIPKTNNYNYKGTVGEGIGYTHFISTKCSECSCKNKFLLNIKTKLADSSE